MKTIFIKGPSLIIRLLLAILLSAGLMFADSQYRAFSFMRYFLNTLVSPMHYIASFPRSSFDSAFESVTSRRDLILTNRILKNEVLQLKSDLLLLNHYQEENKRLRLLLKSPYTRDEKKMVAQVMLVDSSPYRKQILIDKGAADGVYQGQPVINEKGVVGQVLIVSEHESRVLLLIDSNNSIPIQIARNDIRVVATGTGDIQHMRLFNMRLNGDVKEGDLLVTSGLGGRYPEGYPVAKVKSVKHDHHLQFAEIDAAPTVKFDQLRYVLVVWPDDGSPKKLDGTPFQISEEEDMKK